MNNETNRFGDFLCWHGNRVFTGRIVSDADLRTNKHFFHGERICRTRPAQADNKVLASRVSTVPGSFRAGVLPRTRRNRGCRRAVHVRRLHAVLRRKLTARRRTTSDLQPGGTPHADVLSCRPAGRARSGISRRGGCRKPPDRRCRCEKATRAADSGSTRALRGPPVRLPRNADGGGRRIRNACSDIRIFSCDIFSKTVGAKRCFTDTLHKNAL